MTREQAIERWKPIVRCVFAAANAINDEWYDKLRSAIKMPQEEKEKIVDEYCTAIAIEILSGTSDDALKKIESWEKKYQQTTSCCSQTESLSAL